MAIWGLMLACVCWSTQALEVARSANVPPEQLAHVDSVAEYKALLKEDEARGAWQSTAAGTGVNRRKAQSKQDMQLNIGSYPSWKDPICASGGALFCDPDGALNKTAQGRVTDLITHFSERTAIACGHLDSRLAGSDKLVHRPFYLGVAIANEWPQSESDPGSLDQFGQVLLARWGLTTSYNGENLGVGVQTMLPDDVVYDHCPNSAVLIVMPKYGTSFLSSPTCEFFCTHRGGRVVTAKVDSKLSDDGLEAAIAAGILEVRNLLDVASPQSLEEERSSLRNSHPLKERLATQETSWKVAVRIIGALMVVFSIVMAIAFVHSIFFPPKEHINRRTLLGLGGSNKA
mmetsp:Transcript_75/g.102  ORF Transcript_75/g.102 Transcript_75/m.102 type:complete len:345 (+) Transcript_75:143-1177(+)